jgi:hypothetical protein
VVRDPDAAFADYPGLNDAEKDTLRRLDATMLSLLASATHSVPYEPPAAAPEPTPPPQDAAPTPGPVRTALPEIAFLLRVQPTATVDAGGNVSVEVNVVVQPSAAPQVPDAPLGLDAPPVIDTTAAVAAIRAAAPEDRYTRVLDLARLLRHG